MTAPSTGRPAATTRQVAAAVLALATGAAFAAALPPPAGAAQAATSPPTATVVLTPHSNGTTTLVSRGERVVVRLSGDDLSWSEASVSLGSNPPILRKVSGHVSGNGASTTVFRVTGYGTATLEATGTPKCGIAQGCPQFILLWRATVQSPPPPTS